MFIEVDYTKRLQQAKLKLAKPNKKIISPITEKMKDELNLKLGNISELSFTIPYLVEDEENNQLIPNRNTELIKEKMLIEVTMGAYREWFIIDEIEDDGDSVDLFNVKAFSLGYELKYKRISEYEVEVVKLAELAGTLLQDTIWTIGTIDPAFDNMARAFDSGSDSNVLDCINQAGETFGALIEWDTINRKISFKQINASAVFKGMTVNYGKFLRSIKRTRTTDELVTRMYVEGNEQLSIQAVNPTGQRYIEDFSYFMYPFERDANNNVIQSSHFMSNELCHAILDHEKLVAEKTPQIKTLTESLLAKQAEYITEDTVLTELKYQLETILSLLDTAKATENQELIATREAERDAKQAEIDAQQIVVDGLKSEVDTITADINAIQKQISDQANFTPEVLRELNPYIIESTWKDDNYIDAQELYDDALKKFEEIRKPKVVIDVSIDNLMNIMDEQYYWDKLNLGDLIKVKYPQMNIEYMSKIIEISYDLENREASITIANTEQMLNETEQLVKLLYSNSSASSLVQANKYKWDKVKQIQDEVSVLINEEWNANKQKIIAGLNNTVEVGNRGIILTNPDFPQEIVIMQSGIIALSEDAGNTWKTAIRPSGIVAERLIGQIIAGQQLTISNASGSFIMDNSGIKVNATSFIVRSGTNTNLVDEWNSSTEFVTSFNSDSVLTPYEKTKLSEEWNGITLTNDLLTNRLNDYYSDGGSTHIDVVNYHDKYNLLDQYLNVELQADGHAILSATNMLNSSNINATEYATRFREYESAKMKIEYLLSSRAKELSTLAQQTANEAKQEIADVESDIVYKIELTSSKGLTFKNGQIDTTISAKVYRGMSDITSTIPSSGFIWKKYDKDGVLDSVWTMANENIGNVISVTQSDINQKAIFSCDIEIA